MNPSDLPGFDPKVQDQLAQISLDQERRRYPTSSQPPASQHSNQPQYNTFIHPRNMRYSQHRQNRGPPPPQMMPGPDAFPPLGSMPSGSNMPSTHQVHQQGRGHVNSTPSRNSHGVSAAAQDFFSRSRGRGRGRSSRHDSHRQQAVANSDVGPTSSQQNHRWTGSPSHSNFGPSEQYRSNRHRAMDQADYLDHVVQKSMTNMLTREEIEKKHLFRQKLETLAKQVSTHTPPTDPAFDSLQIKLQSYGSLSNSFGTSGCDVDLLLTVEKKLGEFLDLTEQFKRDLEKALLDQGIGARLLTNTRIPIIRVCEKPSAELLKDLRGHREQRENAELMLASCKDKLQSVAPLPNLTVTQDEKQAAAVADLDQYAAEVPLPQTPTIDLSKLEYVGNCGIQCDINFTNRVALYNTKMLWTYGQCDTRVRHMGIFIKNWAKARDINTPYRGTLSSYGYILMVLHYLINVANPPVLPNLQMLAQQDAYGREDAELFEGHDVRFTHDPKRIREWMAGMPKNQNSLGGLLHGFFRYYTARDGFNWTQDVISIRTYGGILSKQAKAWTGAKWTGGKQNVRLRYLLAIEDPFELEHNVARTVGHNGIKAIRDEFRRSWTMIENIQRMQGLHGTSWAWVNHLDNTSGDGLAFIEPREDRGDLLKKDAEFRKEQLKMLKQKVEADEELARKQTLAGASDDELGDLYGMSAGEDTLYEIDAVAEDQSRLIHDIQLQDKKVSRMRGPAPMYRRLSIDEDVTESEAFASAESHALSNDLLNQSPTNHWRIGQTPCECSEVGSEDWATPNETHAHSELDVGGQDNTSADFDKVVDHRRLRDDRRSVSQHSAQSDYDTLKNELDRTVEPNWNGQEKTSVEDKWDDSADLQPNINVDTAPKRSSSPQQTHEDSDRQAHDNLNEADEGEDKVVSEALSSRYKRQLRTSQPPPQPLDNVRQPPQDVPEPRLRAAWQYGQRFREPDRVGRFIRWSSDTVGGKWLLQRDASIRDGKPQEYTAGDKGRLNAKFPYDPRMTPQELAEKNVLLQSYYKATMYPRLSPDMHSKSPQADKVTVEIQSPVEKDSWMETNANHTKANLDHIIDTGRIDDGIYWSDMTGIGRWLYWRDKKILRGTWEPGESLAAAVSNLFPRDSNTTVGDMIRMNWELDNFFAGLSYPRLKELTHSEMDEAATAIRDAIQRTLEYRAAKIERFPHAVSDTAQCDLMPSGKASEEPAGRFGECGHSEMEHRIGSYDDSPSKATRAEPTETPPVQYERHQQTERSRLLLDMFKREDTTSLNQPGHTLDPRDQQEINDRSMQAVLNLSERLSRDTPNDIDFVRAQRLAFFTKIEPAMGCLQETLPRSKPTTQTSGRRDSGAEGSWNRSRSTSSDNSRPCLDHVNLANLQKRLSPSKGPTHSGEDMQHICNQHDPASTDSSAGEVIPNSLKPGSWRERKTWQDRFEDPRIMPIPRTLGYVFDPGHLKDLENMINGGNGCAREGQNAFRMEWNKPGYVWGGGGDMAQQLIDHSNNDFDVYNDNEPTRIHERQALLAELPGLADD